MALTFGFFNSATGDRRLYSAADFARRFSLYFTSGVFRGTGLDLRVATGTGMTLNVGAGAAHLNGYYCETITGEVVPVTPASGANRIDRMVLRLDLDSTSRNVTLVMKQGGASAPALTRTSTMWEISLAKITVRTGITTVSSADITDERGDMSVCGYVSSMADPSYYPPSDIPLLVWLYTFFPNTLTAAQIAEVEGNPSLMAIYNGSRLSTEVIRKPYTKWTGETYAKNQVAHVVGNYLRKANITPTSMPASSGTTSYMHSAKMYGISATSALYVNTDGWSSNTTVSAQIATISGETVTLSTPINILTGGTWTGGKTVQEIFQVSTNVFMVHVLMGSSTHVVPLYISGTTITPSAVIYFGGWSYKAEFEVLDTTRFVAVYQTSSGATNMRVLTVAVSGTTITITQGTEVVVASTGGYIAKLRLMDTNRCLLMYFIWSSGTSTYTFYSRVVTFSASTITINANVTTIPFTGGDYDLARDYYLWQLSTTQCAILLIPAGTNRIYRGILNVPTTNVITVGTAITDFGFDFSDGSATASDEGIVADKSGTNRIVALYRGYLMTVVWTSPSTFTLRVTGTTPIRDLGEYRNAQNWNRYSISGKNLTAQIWACFGTMYYYVVDYAGIVYSSQYICRYEILNNEILVPVWGGVVDLVRTDDVIMAVDGIQSGFTGLVAGRDYYRASGGGVSLVRSQYKIGRALNTTSIRLDINDPWYQEPSQYGV